MTPSSHQISELSQLANKEDLFNPATSRKTYPMTIVASVLAALFLLLSHATQAQTPDKRLLPESFINSLQVKWTQDGRVVDLEIGTPPGEQVVVELKLIFNYRRCVTLFTMNGMHDPDCPESPESRTLTVELQPRTKNKLTLEIASKYKVESLLIDSVRGRPLSNFEALRAKLK